jgi:hypothetical protein
MSDAESNTDRFLGREIVLDLASPYVILGTFRGCDAHHYVVENADVHDLRDTTTTRELYVLDAKRHGINCNRKRAIVRMENVVSLALLADVVE